ncbi:MAG: DUF1800 domain-containing protein [Burkholderiaceae bacterium]|nr:DUF1800 domain-containing protein [Burkholderiaceae bacterium]
MLTRAGFAPHPAEVARFAGLDQAAAVDRLLAAARAHAVAQTPAPRWVDEPFLSLRSTRGMDEAQRAAQRERSRQQALELRAWWLQEMATTPAPLRERMTLFWHNHFVSALPKVRSPVLMYRQNVMLRRHALGSFRVLLKAVAKDPAMLIYLDGAASRRGAPNENFARELMELFTLGPGNYTEQDIREAARAFTGWSVDPDHGEFVFRRAWHDDGEKRLFGRSGRFDGDAVLDILLEQPAAAGFIVEKLWREFVSPQPDPPRVQTIARALRASDYDITVALRALLLQPEVVAGDPADALVKSPAELVVGLARQFHGELAPTAAHAVAAMGQNLFAPPSVRGWPGGEDWINTQTLLARKRFVMQAFEGAPSRPAVPKVAGDDPAMAGAERVRSRVAERLPAIAAVRIDASRWLHEVFGFGAERPLDLAAFHRLAGTLLSLPPTTSLPAGSLAGDALRALVLDPAYQTR